jgi:hypothetical protein
MTQPPYSWETAAGQGSFRRPALTGRESLTSASEEEAKPWGAASSPPKRVRPSWCQLAGPCCPGDRTSMGGTWTLSLLGISRVPAACDRDAGRAEGVDWPTGVVGHPTGPHLGGAGPPLAGWTVRSPAPRAKAKARPTPRRQELHQAQSTHTPATRILPSPFRLRKELTRSHEEVSWRRPPGGASRQRGRRQRGRSPLAAQAARRSMLSS